MRGVQTIGNPSRRATAEATSSLTGEPAAGGLQTPPIGHPSRVATKGGLWASPIGHPSQAATTGMARLPVCPWPVNPQLEDFGLPPLATTAEQRPLARLGYPFHRGQ